MNTEVRWVLDIIYIYIYLSFFALSLGSRRWGGLVHDVGVLRRTLLHAQLKLCGFVQKDGRWQEGVEGGTELRVHAGGCGFWNVFLTHASNTRTKPT